MEAPPAAVSGHAPEAFQVLDPLATHAVTAIGDSLAPAAVQALQEALARERARMTPLPPRANSAVQYATTGWAVFACDLTKRPLVVRGFHAASRDTDQVTAWWSRWPDASIGAAVPPASAVIVVDGETGEQT